ncbi:hypothetical protein V6N11_081626 [Hibiscus sabdariffa]|uniref:ATPase AAA-type core domain-containing protein n=1 Tax=Hibiscus sabdariffa TaxID=183260 RepID=A0ABR2N8W0_9ROSI
MTQFIRSIEVNEDNFVYKWFCVWRLQLDICGGFDPFSDAKIDFVKVDGVVELVIIVETLVEYSQYNIYLILDALPSEYNFRVKAVEVDEKPTQDYNDIGDLEKQIQELVESIVLSMSHKEWFQKLRVRPPKEVLLCGPPGTRKILTAHA